MNHLAIDNLTFAYTPKHPTLKDVTLTIPVNSWTLFYGASGSGKSTLMRLLAGLLPKYGGRILRGNIKLPNNLTVAMMFQDPGMQFALDTPQHELEFALENLQLPSSEMPARIEHALKFCGIEHLRDRQLTTMSGGEQQRIAIARSLLNEPGVIIADEPTGNLDNETADGIMTLLTSINRSKGTAVVMVTHNKSIFENYPGRVLVCKDEACNELK